ncbi:MAG: restriction endonuclease [Acidobacteria bacterium]|nr:restriction endonuclease [Acidobacteriota bacterium]
MALDLIPKKLRQRFCFDERGHAAAILAADFPEEFAEILACLGAFTLRKSHILTPGGGRSPIPIAIDGFLARKGWSPKSFDIKITVDGQEIPVPTHKIDNFKNRVGVEVEWNNKTEFYDRDLNNFRLLKELKVLSVGVIITRLSELQVLFNDLGKGESYGPSTTHWDKLIPKVDGGGAGGCPLLLIGMGMGCYDPEF